ncbi:hypothetical protein KCU71_g50, partial [Aureobasidium melanogenum]
MVATMRGINALVVLKLIIAQVVVPRSIEMMNVQRHKRYILLQHLPIGEKEGRRTQARASSKIITYGGLNFLIGSSLQRNLMGWWLHERKQNNKHCSEHGDPVPLLRIMFELRDLS